MTPREQAAETLRQMAEEIRGETMYGEPPRATACELGAQALDAGGWQSMETAPKDGTQVLLSCHGVLMTGEWHDPHWWDHYLEYTCQPTHWQHLPPAPPGDHP